MCCFSADIAYAYSATRSAISLHARNTHFCPLHALEAYIVRYRYTASPTRLMKEMHSEF